MTNIIFNYIAVCYVYFITSAIYCENYQTYRKVEIILQIFYYIK